MRTDKAQLPETPSAAIVALQLVASAMSISLTALEITVFY